MNWDVHRVTLIGIVVLLIPPLFFNGGRTIPRLFTLIALFAVLALALNIVFGHTDQLLLFTGAMAATGGYTTVMLADYFGVSPWYTLLVGGLAAGLIGAVVTYVAARRGLGIIVIAILTLALQFSFIELINHFRDYTRGERGLRVTDLTITPLEGVAWLDEPTILFYVVGLLLISLMLLYHYLMNSKYGLAFEMIRQDQGAAESIGVNAVRYKVIAAFVATFAMGLTGVFFGQRAGLMFPTTFAFQNIDVLVLIMLVIGGMRTMYGPLIGATVVVVINDQLREAAEYRLMLFGLLLVVLFLYFRSGIVPWAINVVRQHELVQRSRGVISGIRTSR